MGYVHDSYIKKKVKITLPPPKRRLNPEFERLKGDLYNYEKTVIRIDDAVHSGEDYKKLESLMPDFRYNFNDLKRSSVFEELPNVMQIEKTLEDIDYESGLLSTFTGYRRTYNKPKSKFNGRTDSEHLSDYVLAAICSAVPVTFGVLLFIHYMPAMDDLATKNFWGNVGYLLLSTPIIFPLSLKIYDEVRGLPERIRVFNHNRGIDNFYKTHNKKIKKYSKNLVKDSKTTINYIKKRLQQEK
jgi:hypothetical protein